MIILASSEYYMELAAIMTKVELYANNMNKQYNVKHLYVVMFQCW